MPYILLIECADNGTRVPYLENQLRAWDQKPKAKTGNVAEEGKSQQYVKQQTSQ